MRVASRVVPTSCLLNKGNINDEEQVANRNKRAWYG
jgi:hypothetical protein